MAINKIFITGNITKDVEIKKVGEHDMLPFTVAVTNYYKKDDSGNPQPDFFYCEAWGKTAEYLAKNANKGDFIAVNGSMISHSYQDKNGNNRVAWKVNVESADLVKRKKADENTTAEVSGNTNESQATVNDDELPF